MQNRPLNVEPIAVTDSVANLFNCAITSLSGPVGFDATQPYVLITHMRIVNTTDAAITISLWKGETGASASGTEFAWSETNVPANSALDWYGRARFDSGDFLTGEGGATGLTLNIDSAEIGFS